jgi:hypothetical protein
MKNDARTSYVLRDTILNLLSDHEVASVSTAETGVSLADGDEYVDLEQLDRGVTQAHGKTTPMGRVLPRKSVREETWSLILTQLSRPSVGAAHPVG